MALMHSEQLPIGWEAKDFSLIDTEGNRKTLEEYKQKKGLLIVFTCNHCPYAQAAWPLLIELSKQFESEVACLSINPNDEKSYPDDSYEQMKVKKNEWGIPFPYLRDETQEVAKVYKAVCTPDPYLFKIQDGKVTLFYHGRINDNWQNPSEVQEKNLESAIQALVRDQSPPENQPPSMGCSIKWKEESFEETLE